MPGSNLNTFYSNLYKARTLIYEHHKYNEAKKILADTLAIDMNNAEIYALMGFCEEKLGNRKNADELLLQSLNVDAEFSTAYYLQSVIHSGRQEFTKAINAIDSALTLEPENAEFLYTKASIFYQLGNLDATRYLIEKGLAIEPEHEGFLKLKSLCFISINQTDAAEFIINKNLQNNANDAENLRLKGWMQFNRGNLEGAEKSFIDALRSDPENELAKDGLIEVKKGQWPFLNFFIKMGFRKYTFNLQWNIGTIFLLIIGIKGLPLWLGLFSIYLLVCWYCDVLYESIIRIKPISRYLLTKDKIRRSDIFLITNAICLILIFLPYEWKSDITWIIFTLLLCGIFIMSSYFESWRRATKRNILLVAAGILGLSLLTYFSGESLTFFIVISALLTSLYGLLWSFNIFGH
jgi:tetratricopeptide (TPR) repeat protein